MKTLRIVADNFKDTGIRRAIEQSIRSGRVSLYYIFGHAKRYIKAVGGPAVQHIIEMFITCAYGVL